MPPCEFENLLKMGEEAVFPGDMAEENPSLKRDRLCFEEDEGELCSNKKQAKEASNNDDINSEISNPEDITSHAAAQSSSGDRVGSCSGSDFTSSNETISDEKQSESSSFVMEIPKHLSTTGITKITFKLSKPPPKEDEALCHLPRTQQERASSNVVSKKKVCDFLLSNVKKLLLTGILDGARVKYISNSPLRELDGIIHSGGYLCGCTACNFMKVLGAHEFEKHAGRKTKHPNIHIFLENGRSVYNVVQVLKTAPVGLLEEVIRKVAGSALNEEGFHTWKESLEQHNNMAEDDWNHTMDSSFQSLVSYPGSGRSLDESQVYTPPCYFPETNYIRKKVSTKLTLDEQKPKAKKVTSHMFGWGYQKKVSKGGNRKRDNDLHRVLFLPNGLPDGTELAYYMKGKNLLQGYKQGSGIVCSCCDRVISPSQFESHAGMSIRRQPYRHICISSGLSLHDIALSLADGHVITNGDSDDMCCICGVGGDLLLCAGCPQAFHTACLKFQSMPEGSWYCSSCNDRPISSKTAVAINPNSKPIVIRPRRVVKPPESEIGGCVFCRSHDFSVGKFDDRTVILCDQCEKEYHVGCLRENELCDLKGIPQDKWFCCSDCSRIHTALQSSVSCGLQTIPTLLLETISRKYKEKGINTVDNGGDTVEWMMLSGKSRCPEHEHLLSRTSTIFRECFDPIVAKSGRDLIPVMVYGRNISGQEFGGMYCLVLMVNSLVVSAALLRIFGQKVAELPMVATSREYQGRGYFQVLFACIENLLSSLSVENLLLPAAQEAESIWTKKFGFTKMAEHQLNKYQREVQLTIFKGTSMLEKKVP
ncbi:hypothetical protein N665_0436s0055 [Sinapis alba]|nr:hypothetical protein N665_0436s0055 [Sinapis alba]